MKLLNIVFVQKKKSLLDIEKKTNKSYFLGILIEYLSFNWKKINFVTQYYKTTKKSINITMALDFVATYKVLVLGDSNVGKTCIVHRYCDEKYYDTYISTIGKQFSLYYICFTLRFHCFLFDCFVLSYQYIKCKILQIHN